MYFIIISNCIISFQALSLSLTLSLLTGRGKQVGRAISTPQGNINSFALYFT